MKALFLFHADTFNYYIFYCNTNITHDRSVGLLGTFQEAFTLPEKCSDWFYCALLDDHSFDCRKHYIYVRISRKTKDNK